MSISVVLITGALTGIGRATALAFAREGAAVMVSGRRDEVGAELVTELRGLGGEAEYLRADVRNEHDVSALLGRVVARFGRLDVAVNNAGTEGHAASALEFTEENYSAIFDTNVRGTFICLKHELAVMVPQGSGAIINLSSIAGRVGFANASLYAASKHAVEGLTKSIALEVAAHGITVNAVAPGPVQTGMLDRFTGDDHSKAGFLDSVPAKRAATVDEVADTIVFAASSKSRYLTGQSIVLDGGYTAR